MHPLFRVLFNSCLPGAVLLALSEGVVASAESVVMSPAAQSADSDADQPRFGLRGFVHGGFVSLTAKQSFEAITGDSSGRKIGGGAQVTFPNGIFIQGSLERFRKSGSRAFVFDGEVFPLGIENTITVTPITFTGGYRFKNLGPVVPYVGGGFGSYGLREVSEFDQPDEMVDERFTGYHALGGAEFGLWRRDRLSIDAAAEVEYASVPDALGTGGVSQEFLEDDLGGTTIRFKVHFGFGVSRRTAAPAPPPRLPPRPTREIPQEIVRPPEQEPTPPVEIPQPQEPLPPPTVPAPAPSLSPLDRGRELLRSGDYVLAADAFREYLRIYGPGKFTIPVGLYCEIGNLTRQIRNAGGSDQLFLLHFPRRGGSCFGVYWGLYNSRRDAQGSMSILPAAFRVPGQAPIAVSRLIR